MEHLDYLQNKKNQNNMYNVTVVKTTGIKKIRRGLKLADATL